MGVEFQEDNTRRDFGTERTPKLAAWLMSHGMASDLASANKFQLVMALVFIVLSIIVFVAF